MTRACALQRRVALDGPTAMAQPPPRRAGRPASARAWPAALLFYYQLNQDDGRMAGGGPDA